VEWWLHDCDLPSLTWARLRVFNDGTADACWADRAKLYGFAAREFAGYFLAEDEYLRFSGLDKSDALDRGVDLASIEPPVWTDSPEQPFEYLGTY
jgi:hypothetical protein